MRIKLKVEAPPHGARSSAKRPHGDPSAIQTRRSKTLSLKQDDCRVREREIERDLNPNLTLERKEKWRNPREKR